MVERGYRVITFFGETDGSCNMELMYKWLKNIWPQEKYKKFREVEWSRHEFEYVYKKFDNVIIAMVDNSGHLVSYERPDASYNLVKDAIQNDGIN